MTDAAGSLEMYLPGRESALHVAADDLDAVRAAVVSYLPLAAHGTPLRIYHSRRARLPSGFPDHELQLVADEARRTGALRYMADGVWFTLGTAPSDGSAAVGALYSYPENTELPFDRLVAAVEEFAASAERPTAVDWQDDPDDF